jgi:hypothetical protein
VADPKHYHVYNAKAQELFSELDETMLNLIMRVVSLCSPSGIPGENWYIFIDGQTSWYPMAHHTRVLGRSDIESSSSADLPPLPLVNKANEEFEDSTLKQIREVVTTHRLVKDKETPSRVVKMSDIPDVEVENEGSLAFFTRESPRFDARLRVEIEFESKIFTTYTKNVSVGGALFEDPVPTELVGYFKVKLINLKNNEKADVTCSVADNQTPDSRYRVEFARLTTRNLVDLFEDWLKSAS